MKYLLITCAATLIVFVGLLSLIPREKQQVEPKKRATGGSFRVPTVEAMESHNQPGDDVLLKYRTIAACRNYISARLLSPDGSKFLADYEDAKRTGAGSWVAVGAVDVMNGYGARIRRRYICIATAEGSAMRVLRMEWQ